MDQNPEIYDLLFSNIEQIPYLVDSILSFSPSKGRLTILETDSVSAEHTKEFVYRGIGKYYTIFSNKTCLDFTRARWHKEGILDKFPVNLLVEPLDVTPKVDLAFCTNPLLFLTKYPREIALKNYLKGVTKYLKDKGRFVLFYDEVAFTLLNPMRLEAYSWTTTRGHIKATIKISNLRLDWIQNYIKCFMEIRAENVKLHRDAIAPIGADLQMGIFSPGDICRIAKRAGFSRAEVFTNSLEKVDSCFTTDELPFLVFTK